MKYFKSLNSETTSCSLSSIEPLCTNYAVLYVPIISESSNALFVFEVERFLLSFGMPCIFWLEAGRYGLCSGKRSRQAFIMRLYDDLAKSWDTITVCYK